MGEYLDWLQFYSERQSNEAPTADGGGFNRPGEVNMTSATDADVINMFKAGG